MSAPGSVAVEVVAPALGRLLAGRFRLRAQLGAGAFGAVYSAVDERDGALVAIKWLKRAGGAAIYRFKQEFRVLAGLRHRNLVRLHELLSEGDDWFFSMELVDGVPFDVWVLGRASAGGSESTTSAEGSLPTEPSEAIDPPSPDLGKLRAALPQLHAGICALHQSGVVHRDLKPGNVLVTPEGRVVILDFGLAADVDPDAQQSTIGAVIGTPSYMAPEQALGRTSSFAADWYAFGVMLYEALEGVRPFRGTSHDALTLKLSPSLWPRPQRAGVVPELERLARELLAPEPQARPDPDRIAVAVGAEVSPTGSASAASPGFVGRAAELGALEAAFAAAVRGRTVVVRVRGPSGVGKSALVRQFTSRLGADVTLLEGRCYEREQVPYKALDGVVDALTRALRRLQGTEARLLLPRDAQALCRLFPVFSRLELFADEPERARSSTPHEERRRGVLALRELLQRLTDRRPLVMVIDDLQWGDLDSIEPLRELLAPPDPPPLLLVLVSRAEDEQRSPVLRGIGATRLAAAPEDQIDIDVAPLRPEDALALAERLLPASQRHHAAAIARESGGLPFYLPELARAQQRGPQGDGALSLDAVVRQRLLDMSAAARRLLTVVAVAGRPVPRRAACHAAGIEAPPSAAADRDGAAAVEELVAASLLRRVASDASADGLLEPFHDRVRESVAAAVDPAEARAIHSGLAAALGETANADPEALAEHHRLAGELDRARPAAIAAAERAADAFAFARAVALFSAAREGAPSSERRLLTARLADVLAYAGRSREAAQTYLEAANGAADGERRDLQHRAVELFMRCGAVPEGLALARTLAAEAGLRWPEGPRALIASVAWQKLRLALRGSQFTERPPAEIGDEGRRRVDLCWTLGGAFAPRDFLRAADFQTLHFRLALDLGEPYRLARGMALEAIIETVEAKAGTEELAGRSLEIAKRIDEPHAIGWALASHAVIDFTRGRWRQCVARIEEAFAMLRARAPEGIWEHSLLEVWFKGRSLLYLGELETFVRETARCSRAAQDRGDQLVLLLARAVGDAQAALIRDEPAQARELSMACVRGTDAADGWHFPHQENLRTLVQCDVYEGRAAEGLARIDEHWGRLKRSLLLRAHHERVLSGTTFTNAAVAAKDHKQARRWFAVLSGEPGPWAAALASAARAGLMALDGSVAATVAYEQAAVQLEALEMVPFALAARRRRAELLGGSDGAALIETIDRDLRARGVVRPDRWAPMLVS